MFYIEYCSIRNELLDSSFWFIIYAYLFAVPDLQAGTERELNRIEVNWSSMDIFLPLFHTNRNLDRLDIVNKSFFKKYFVRVFCISKDLYSKKNNILF